MKRFPILFCDLDDTLIHTRSKAKFAKGIWDLDFDLRVFEQIKRMHPSFVFVITNQGGIGTYFTEEEFEAKLNFVCECIKSYVLKNNNHNIIVDSIYCPSMDKNDKFRKPNPGMLQYMCDSYDLFETYDKDDMMMIGDASGLEGNFSDSDKKCADNFGIIYCDVNEFLKISKFEDK